VEEVNTQRWTMPVDLAVFEEVCDVSGGWIETSEMVACSDGWWSEG